MILSIFIGMDDIGPEGGLIFLTIESQKQRGHSSSKFKLEGGNLYSIIVPFPKKETTSRI